MKKENKKVVVAFSGGVDSSVSAFLLKKQGYEVVALHMKLFHSDSKKIRKLAEAVGVDFKEVDLRKEFKKKIIEGFVSGYKKGVTPNPCVVCNKEIKFGLFIREAEKMKADLVATGHYARAVKKGDTFHLLKGKDLKKDQSYFLYRLSQKQLIKVVFPLSSYSKQEVRKIAAKNKIARLALPESQEVCFAGPGFLKKRLGVKKGKMIDKEGNVMGEHEGVWFYTIGQRKGIGLSGGPYYVIGKNAKRNELVVSGNAKDLFRKEVSFRDASWVSGTEPDFPIKAKAKIRYGHKAASGELDRNRFVFYNNQRAITPGQSIVFYKGSEVIGGGIII
ncbi:MAG: tRNA 2-thiouridine(34) synthase MnmA [Candidatus Pacebacteria bacterium]|nr:tRNA 2-thiouridine(34) synthase MnmA [Candidatus Paceibacterota bacterium]